MKNYFLQQSTKKIGPLSFDELIDKKPKKSDLIWKVGTEEWVEAHSVEELDSYFRKIDVGTPPLSPLDKINEKKRLEITRGIVVSLILSIILISAILFLYIMVGEKNNNWLFRSYTNENPIITVGSKFFHLFPYCLALIPLIASIIFCVRFIGKTRFFAIIIILLSSISVSARTLNFNDYLELDSDNIDTLDFPNLKPIEHSEVKVESYKAPTTKNQKEDTVNTFELFYGTPDVSSENFKMSEARNIIPYSSKALDNYFSSPFYSEIGFIPGQNMDDIYTYTERKYLRHISMIALFISLIPIVLATYLAIKYLNNKTTS